MGKSTPGHERRAADAKKRLEGATALSPQQKLERLDRSLGVSLGAKKERARLAAKIAGPRTTPPPTSAGPTSAEVPVLLAADGEVQMTLTAGKVQIIVGNRQTPVISMSQLRRMGDQHGFDGSEFARQYRAYLQASGQ